MACGVPELQKRVRNHADQTLDGVVDMVQTACLWVVLSPRKARFIRAHQDTQTGVCVCARGNMLRSAQERRHSDLSLPGKMHHNVPLHFRPAQFSFHVALVAISFAGCVLGCSFSFVFSSTQHPAQIKKTRYLPKSTSTILHHGTICSVAI